MFNWWVDFDAPQYLILLLLLPVFWLVGRRSLSALGRWRRTTVLGLRLAVAALLIVALAEPNWLTLMHRLTVLFVVDASNSIERSELDDALAYVNAAAQQRDAERGDRAGVVVFGREAGVEVPPIDQPWRLARIESELDPRFTNLESALKVATAAFPSDSAKRVVIISDGNENAGRAVPQAAALLDSGVGIDCVPIRYKRRGEVRVEKVAVPADIRRGTPFMLRVVLDNLTTDRTIPGGLRISRSLGGVEHSVADEMVQLAPGKRVFTVRQELAEAGISTYQARFVPDNPADDAHLENNVATGFSRVGGQGHVLLIEDAALAGRFDPLVQLLRRNDIEVTVRDTRWPYDDLADLQQFDCVILADVARVAGEAASDLTQFSDAQIQALVQNTEHFGSGLLVLGGPNSFGAGGWTNSKLEKALPVDFQIDNAKVEASGALLLVVDSSGSMSGPKIVWSKAAAIAAAQMLSRRDYLGVVSFDSEAHWVVPLRRNDAAFRAKQRIDRLGAGGGTDMMPALRQAYEAIQKVDASLKHVIVLTDGQTPKENYESLVSDAQKNGITTTGVAVGPDADRLLLADIGRRGGGKFYQVLSPRAIPRIFMREARRVTMPLVFEDRNGIAVNVVGSSELLSGIDSPPPTSGYVLTTVKQDPLVEVLMTTPRQVPANSTILATWQYGLGRAAVLTTDIGQRWAIDWPAWGNYEKLMLQLVRWSMRSHDMNEQLVMTAENRHGAIEVIINAIDRDDAHLNFLSLLGTVVLPNGQTEDFALEQAAPGRYTARFEADEPGNYYLSVSGGSRNAPWRAAVSIPPTAELDSLVSHEGFLAGLAEGTPRDGEPGRLIHSSRGLGDTDGLLATDVFRPGLAPAQSRDMMWPLVLLLGSVAFFGDVFCRRVAISLSWLPQVLRRLPLVARPAPASGGDDRMERLRHTKSRATVQFGRAGATARFEPATPPDHKSEIDSRSESLVGAEQGTASGPATPAPTAEPLPEENAPSEYTARLLDAKKRAQRQRDSNR
jgi:Mg-chelatase subunit ChlD